MINNLQLLFIHTEDPNEQQMKQSTAFIDPIIFDLLQSDIDFNNENHKRVQTLKQNEQYSIKNDQNFLQFTQIQQSQSKILITFKYFRRKFNKREIWIFHKIVNKQQQSTNHYIKQYMNEGYLIFVVQVFLDKHCQIQCLKDFIKLQKEKINNLILNFENLISCHLKKVIFTNLDTLVRKIKNFEQQSDIYINNNLQLNKVKVKLLQLISVLDQKENTKTILMQIYGENNLLEVKYKSSFKLNNQQLSLINNGTVNNLEQKVNAQLNSFNSKIQDIFFNLFLQQYYDSKNQRSFIFQEYQSLSDYFSGFKHQLDTFEIRIHILIQIFCVYLLKIQLNFDQSFPQNDVILINSNKQIKLDMFQFQTNIQCKNNQSNQSINEEQHSLLKYFELLIPKKEKQILIGDFNLTKELEMMKQSIAKNEIKLYYLIDKLIMIEELILEKLNSLF